MKKMFMALALSALSIVSGTTVFAGTPDTEIVPYAQLGTCPKCNYGAATLTTEYGEEYTDGGTFHIDHVDYYYKQDLYYVLTCPNCGTQTKWRTGSGRGEWRCPMGLY